jgi:carbon monoxide dehydrogenase subunit G
MKLDIGGEQEIAAAPDALWVALNDPMVLTRCIPGCKEMIETAPDAYKVLLQLKVASVGGSFEGAISLADKVAPRTCMISVSGAGTLGAGKGEARFEIVPIDAETSRLVYHGEGEIGGLVAGVGQRILGGVSKHLIGRFFTALRKEFGATAVDAA